MRQIALVSAAIAFALVPSALSAQQTSSGQQSTSVQPTPEAEPLPAPPPLPPFARAQPSHRWVDVGGQRRSSPRHHAKHEKHQSGRLRHEPIEKHHEVVHASKRTIRRCHSMTYTQIMRQSSCRALITQDLDTAEHHHAQHHDSKHRDSKRHDSARHRATHHNMMKRRHRD